ncbi:MAG: polysaccharide deacetylase family protein [Bacteroidota bacterium]
MAGRRAQFIRRFAKLGQSLPVSLLMRLTGQRVLVVLYHAVTDEAPPHLRHLYRIKTRAEFSADLDHLLRFLQPIDVHALRDHVTGRERLRKPGLLVTFDDGLREFHDVAAPILRAKGVPAICFLNSDFVDNRGLFYRYTASLLADRAGAASEEAAYRKRILGMGYDGENILLDLAHDEGLDLRAYLREQRPYLSSGEILALQNQGFHFGAHSVDHPEYKFLDLETQLRQTRRSQDYVEAHFGVKERWFAFPFTDHGVGREFFQRLFAGKNAPELTFGCAGLKRDIDRRHVQRIPLEMDGLSAREILPAEFLYYFAKAPLGKNKIRRA